VGEPHVTRMQKATVQTDATERSRATATVSPVASTNIKLYIPSEGMASNTTYLLAYLYGRDTHKAVSDRLVTEKAGIRSQVSPHKWHRDRMQLVQATATSDCLFYSETQRRSMGIFVKPLQLICF
jgi:hypothetical protein